MLGHDALRLKRHLYCDGCIHPDRANGRRNGQSRRWPKSKVNIPVLIIDLHGVVQLRDDFPAPGFLSEWQTMVD